MNKITKVGILLLEVLSCNVMNKSSLANELGRKNISGDLKKQLKNLRDLSLVELTIPEKPKSRNQKYRITESGRSFLHKVKK